MSQASCTVQQVELNFEERVKGCLLAGAVGDALGAPIEFDAWDRIRADHGDQGVTAMLPPGRFTDDTQMTLFTAEGLVRASVRGREKGICHPPSVVHHAYLRWLHTQGVSWDSAGGPFARTPGTPDGWLVHDLRLHRRAGPGATCLSALGSGVAGTTEEPVNDSKGCGAVMRAAPVGLAMWRDDAEHIYSLGCDIGALTHGHPDGWHSAGALALMIALILQGATLDDAVDITIPWTSESVGSILLKAVEVASSGPPDAVTIEQQFGGGWVGEEALGIAVCCARAAPDVSAGLLAAVNHSGDSDSTGSICGQLLGALRGPDEIPPEWLDSLDSRDLVATVAADLAFETASPPADGWGASPEWWRLRYPGW